MLKYFGTPLVEDGPCSIDPGQHAPQGEPEGEPEGELEGEPEGEPEKGADAEPNNQLRAEPEPEVGKISRQPEPEPEKINQAAAYPEPEPEPEREETFIGKGWKRGRSRRRGSQVPRPEAMSRDPSKKVYFIGS